MPATPDSAGAARLYGERLDHARTQTEALRARERSLGNYRLATFLAGIAIAWLAFDRDAIPRLTVLLPLAAFVGLALQHGRVIARRKHFERITAHYQHGLARIEGGWTEYGHRGDRFVDASHPYASDLDIFGHGSLFQLLCTARSASGHGTLAEWLGAPADPGEIAARQVAVEEVRHDNDRREQLALIGEDIVSDVDPAYLADWAGQPTRPDLRTQRWIAAGLVLVTVATFLLQGFGILPPAVFLVALAAQAAFGTRRRDANRDLTRSLELAPDELRALSHLLLHIENSDFEAPRLKSVKSALGGASGSASDEIARLNRLIQLLDARRNMLFAPVSIFLLWTSQLSMAIESWREANGPHLPAWLRAVGEYESFCALSGFAFEQPETCFPTVSAVDGPRFHASAARHPLMPTGKCVANDVTLDRGCSLLIVSGSNMSGKSTLLRTIGTNCTLAQMGAPVCAAAMTMSPLQVGTSMRTQDSLLDGTSRFYAEIKRLRLVVDLADGEVPLLFLLDEMLAGTNSHDRGIGAEAIVRNLLERGAVGLVTTHDLTLAAIAEELAPRARNVHFSDQLLEGEMIFDYTMHDGPVQKSNALGLMRAIGLGV